MRTYFPDVAGNRALTEKLGAELADGRLSHAYIIEGAKGYGKHTLARQIAMAAACRNRSDASVPLPCGVCPACRKILSGNCPDLLWFSRAPGKASMGVDTVRALREDLALVPNELDIKILVINFDFEPADPTASDKDFLHRITTNYLRHECTSYENELYKLFGKTGVNEAHDILQRRINDEIRRVYPQLK